MLNLKVNVRPGMILINDVYVATETDDYVVIEADLHSKYAEIGGFSKNTIMLVPGERTLKTHPDSSDVTMIEIDGIPEDWDMQVYTARYTVQIVYWKRQNAREDTLWTSPEIWRTNDEGRQERVK